MKNLSRELKKFRTKLKLSQNKFSEKFGFCKGHISKLETGKIKNPEKKIVEKIQSIIAGKYDQIINKKINVKIDLIPKILVKSSSIKKNIKKEKISKKVAKVIIAVKKPSAIKKKAKTVSKKKI